jgi:ABC-type phosphate/phosphonate transport system substrate-binding protein
MKPAITGTKRLLTGTLALAALSFGMACCSNEPHMSEQEGRYGDNVERDWDKNSRVSLFSARQGDLALPRQKLR